MSYLKHFISNACPSKMEMGTETYIFYFIDIKLAAWGVAVKIFQKSLKMPPHHVQVFELNVGTRRHVNKRVKNEATADRPVNA